MLQNSEYRTITRGTGIQSWTTYNHDFVHEDEFETARKWETIFIVTDLKNQRA